MPMTDPTLQALAEKAELQEIVKAVALKHGAGTFALIECAQLAFAAGVRSTREQIVNELHKRVGICGHCGKKKCAGKASYSQLPDKLLLADVLAAIESENEVAITPGATPNE